MWSFQLSKMGTADSDVSISTGRKHRLRCGKDANCTATMVVYCLTCSVCKMQYVGQTVNLRKRLNNHKSCIRNFDPRQNTPGYSADGTEVYRHFNQPGHDLNNMRVTILEHVAESSALHVAERKWIWTLETVTPKGVNIDNGFNSHLQHQRSSNVTVNKDRWMVFTPGAPVFHSFL